MPAETTVDAKQIEFAVEQESNEVFASADVKKKKRRKERKSKEKARKRRKAFSQRFSVPSNLILTKNK